VPVSDSDRAYFERIGAYKRQSHDDARARHLALSMDERLERSWLLSRQYAATATEDRRDDDPSAFYARARALGLYEP
jgi:hypothetical protein